MTEDLQQARVTAAAEGMWNRYGDRGMFTHAPEHLRNGFMKDARAALDAADAHLPSVEQIAEVIMRALVFTNENSKPWADGVARDVRALFGEVTGDE